MTVASALGAAATARATPSRVDSRPRRSAIPRGAPRLAVGVGSALDDADPLLITGEGGPDLMAATLDDSSGSGGALVIPDAFEGIRAACRRARWSSRT